MSKSLELINRIYFFQLCNILVFLEIYNSPILVIILELPMNMCCANAHLCYQGLGATWWSIHQQASWRLDVKFPKAVSIFHWPLYGLLQLQFEIFHSSNVIPGDIGNLDKNLAHGTWPNNFQCTIKRLLNYAFIC